MVSHEAMQLAMYALEVLHTCAYEGKAPDMQLVDALYQRLEMLPLSAFLPLPRTEADVWPHVVGGGSLARGR